MLFQYAPGRSGTFAKQFLDGFNGCLLQCDAYDGYDRLTEVARPQGPWTLVHCWSHLRRRFVKLARNSKSPIAEARRPADRTALRHRSHGARFIAGHQAGRPQGALVAPRRGVEAVVREAAVDDLQRLDAR
ncbi:transposase [Bradyrhizobium sp. IC4061]|uniref:IS66 family transposase n=1 Tax=unclassified Bradyrhizobium TaxID=2631580 RepID=UPI0032095931